MDFRIIKYNTPEYEEMVTLRYKILREPLGLTFSEEDLEKDRNDLLLTASFPKTEKIVGCCILSSISDSIIQLRQMAVDNSMQGKGLGRKLLAFAEEVVLEHHYQYIYLHARKVALDFYKKQDYIITGDEFMEVGIPHFEMKKRIKRNIE